jgi:hypothetical protein
MAERAGVHLPPRLVGSMAKLRGDLRQRLGDDEARRAWSESEGLTLDEIVTLAVDDAPSAYSIPPGRRISPGPPD